MIKIGITGGIGSGKSVVSALFELYGIPVYISDTESKYLVEHSDFIRESLIALLGSELYINGTLDKKKLASIIFSNKEILQKVNAIIHPEVATNFIDWSLKQTSDICAIESAILFESGFDSLVDISILVYSPLELRVSRASKRDNSDKEDIKKRISHQMNDEDKRDICQYIIYNDEEHSLISQVENILIKLREIRD